MSHPVQPHQATASHHALWNSSLPAYGWPAGAKLALALTVLLACGQALPALKFFPSPLHYLPLHSGLEFFSMAVSVMVFSLAWSLRNEGNNSNRMVLGVGFLAVCLIDFGHMLSYAGMPELITPSGAEKAINFWLAGRYVVASVLLYVALRPDRHWSEPTCYAALAAACALVLCVWFVGLLRSEWLPRTFIAGQGLTDFKVGSEYVLALLYGSAAVLLLRRGLHTRKKGPQLLAAAAWIQALAELFFTLYGDVTDLFNLLGHIYKVLAYLMVYRAIYASGVSAPYRQLDVERARLRTLLATIPEPVWLKDADGYYLACNSAFERLFGAREANIVGKTDYDFVSAEQADFFRQQDRVAIEAGGLSRNEERLTFAADGYQGVFETSKTPMYSSDGVLIGVLGVAHDITERKQAEIRLHDSEKHFRTLANGGGALIWTSDQTQLLNYFNEPWLCFTGRTLEQELGLGWLSGVHPDDVAACSEAGRSAFVLRRAFSREYRLRHADGSYRWVRDEGSPRYDSQDNFLGYLGFCWDMTEYKLATEKIEQLAFYDALTQLPNRRLMLDRLAQVLAACGRYQRQSALLVMDLDNFKMVNDSMGHAAGDQLLLEAATRLRSALRECDTVARLGGDEFVVILPDLEGSLPARQAAEAVAQKLLDRVNEPYVLALDEAGSTRVHQCSASMGVVLFDDASLSVDELLKRADAALYHVKSGGRNALSFFDANMQQVIARQTQLEQDLRRALEEGQLELYYQPQVDMQGRMQGAEALIRWRHPERGLVSPDDFIPLAEQSGLILPIGLWVLESACQQLARWASDPQLSGLSLSVNVSSCQFSHPDFVEQVLALVDKHEVCAQRLKLELTESLVLDNAEEVVSRMHALKAYSIGLSLDDFGTGYSSLSYLKHLPLDQLKIDRSFVSDLLTDPTDLVIVRAMLALGRSLEICVIAEGVETVDQRNLLASSGCLSYQGYLFSPPLPLAQFEQLACRPACLVVN